MKDTLTGWLTRLLTSNCRGTINLDSARATYVTGQTPVRILEVATVPKTNAGNSLKHMVKRLFTIKFIGASLSYELAILDESNVLSMLTEASPAHQEVVLADNSVTGRAYATKHWVSIMVYRNDYSYQLRSAAPLQFFLGWAFH